MCLQSDAPLASQIAPRSPSCYRRKICTGAPKPVPRSSRSRNIAGTWKSKEKLMKIPVRKRSKTQLSFSESAWSGHLLCSLYDHDWNIISQPSCLSKINKKRTQSEKGQSSSDFNKKLHALRFLCTIQTLSEFGILWIRFKIVFFVYRMRRYMSVS